MMQSKFTITMQVKIASVNIIYKIVNSSSCSMFIEKNSSEIPSILNDT